MRQNFRLRLDPGERGRQARNHRLRKAFNSPGGRNQTSASVARHWRLTSTPSPCSLMARKAASSVKSSPKYAIGPGSSALVSSRSILTTSPLSRPARNSRPASNSSKDKPSAHLRQRLKQRARSSLDGCGLCARHATPVHRYRIQLLFNQPAQGVVAKLRTQRIEYGASLGWHDLQVAPAVGVQPLRAMQSPDLRCGIYVEERSNLSGWASGDDHHARQFFCFG